MTIGTNAMGVSIGVYARIDAQSNGEVSIEYDTCILRDHDEVTGRDLTVSLAILGVLDGVSEEEQAQLRERAQRVPGVVEDVHKWLGAAIAREAGAAGSLEVKNRLGVIGGVRGACFGLRHEAH